MVDISKPKSGHSIGVVLVIISAFVFSTAGIFTKGVTSAAWTIIFWRGVSASFFTLLYLAWRGQLRAEMAAFGRTAALATLLMAAGTAAFIPAFKLTSVANVALIYASAPLLAAGLSWLLLWERSTWTVMVASVGAFAGVLVIVSGSFGASALAGDLLALFMTLMMAGTMIVYRAFPKTTAALPAAVSSVVLLPIACALGRPLDVPTGELPWLILFGVVFAIASVTLAEGARRLPSAETALLSILEVPLAPVLAWAILAETPEARVIGGGGLIVICVIWSQQSGQAARDRQIRRKDT